MTLTHRPPAISIVMPVWNGERYLQEALDGVQGQTFSDYELLVVDDGSTDGTLEILDRAAAADPRIRVIRMEHGGIVPALNKGVEEAQADWIARMDADDIAYPDWLESVWAAHLERPEVVLFHSEIETFGAENEEGFARTPKTRGLYAMRLCVSCFIAHPSVFYSKAAFYKAGGYALEDRHTEDYALWGRMLEIGPFYGLPKCNLKFRLHEASTTAKDRSTQEGHVRRINRLHCEKFLGAKEADIDRILKTLSDGGGPVDWLWFMKTYLPRLKWVGSEALGWCLVRLARSMRRRRS